MRTDSNTKQITTMHEVMTCPACSQTIMANFVVEAVFGVPNLGPGGKVELPVTSVIQRFQVTHPCSGRIAADDAYPAEEMGQ